VASLVPRQIDLATADDDDYERIAKEPARAALDEIFAEVMRDAAARDADRSDDAHNARTDRV
jgi:hypothetical protein